MSSSAALKIDNVDVPISLVSGEQYQAIADLYKQFVRDRMLLRIVCFGGDDEFLRLNSELSNALSITEQESALLIWPTAHALYTAAKESKCE